MKQKQPREKLDEAIVRSIQSLLGIERESFNTMLDDLPVCLWMHDENYTLVYGNHSFKVAFGNYYKQRCYQCLMRKKEVCSCCRSQRSLTSKKPEQCKLCKRRASVYDINMFHTPITDNKGQKFILKSSLHINDLKNLTKKEPLNTNSRKKPGHRALFTGNIAPAGKRTTRSPLFCSHLPVKAAMAPDQYSPGAIAAETTD